MGEGGAVSQGAAWKEVDSQDSECHGEFCHIPTPGSHPRDCGQVMQTVVWALRVLTVVLICDKFSWGTPL